MGIDKCKHRRLFVCPALFEKLYTDTFPAEKDTVHFESIHKSVKEYSSELRAIYKAKQWYRIASFCSGSPPVPYPLYKLKDLIVPCAKVLESKGKCCRCRPISPKPDHLLRRFYKPAGAVLRVV